MKILLVEDDDTLIKVFTRTLKPHHYTIDAVKDGEMGWTYSSTFDYDLIVLDIVLPKLDGISLCKRLRAEEFTTPILMLTSQDSSSAKVQGLDAGADDYMVKPFDPAELLARIRALLRRGSTNPFPLLTWGDLILNPSTCEVSYQGKNLPLTTKEYDLLELMMRQSQHVFSSDELLDHLWSSEKFPSEATVRSHIRRLRQKLTEIGAPPDFIATMHGRGYYLKALSTDAAELPASVPQSQPLEAPIHVALSEEQNSTDLQTQYLAFLNETWTTTKPNCLDQISTLLQVVQELHRDLLTAERRLEAHQLAHKLAGTLGIFGLNKAVHLARQLEYWLGSSEQLRPKQAPLMQSIGLALHQEVQSTTIIHGSQVREGETPLLVLINSERELTRSLATIATNRGVRLENIALLDIDSILTEIDAIAENHPPSLLLLQLSSEQIELGLQTLHVFSQRYPDLPIVALGDQQLRFSDRIRITRSGAQLLLDQSTSPEQIIAASLNLLKRSDLVTKVMIVDDDTNFLQALPSLLNPWGFKVTTLADPQQFWTVLQAISPDVLVLDVNMPEINGFELCQVLRSDPQWHRLPVLFLSALSDATTQQHAFKVGADDYLCKPLLGGELASRIRQRLQRLRAWAS